jgi:hypothetical protein
MAKAKKTTRAERAPKHLRKVKGHRTLRKKCTTCGTFHTKSEHWSHKAHHGEKWYGRKPRPQTAKRKKPVAKRRKARAHHTHEHAVRGHLAHNPHSKKQHRVKKHRAKDPKHHARKTRRVVRRRK